jgi:hypothetical protein
VKYVLIDKNYEVIDKIDSVTPGGAEHYFMGRKQIKDKESFYKLWRVLPKKEYDLNMEAFARKSSSHPINWWKDEWTNPDIDVIENGK